MNLKKIIIEIIYIPSQIYGIFLLNSKKVKYGEKIKFRGLTFLRGKGEIDIGNNVIFNSGIGSSPISCGIRNSIYVKKGAKLTIGSYSGVSSSAIYCNKRIEIGEYVFIGAGCKIVDTDFHSVLYENRIKKQDMNIIDRPVIISDGVFIGMNSLILKGAHIGEKSVIAAGSVVTKNIPDNELWGGNPAKFIKKI